MSQKFTSSIQHRGDVSFVKLAGVIDEDNELGELVEKIPTGTAVIDLGEIERINSCGVRDWVNWLSKIEGNGTHSVLVECSPAIVAQINLVNNFTGNGVVKSFYVPYFCSECDEEKVLLVETSDMGPPPHEPPTCRCDECDLVMDFDDMPDSYFAFLSSQKKVTEPEHGSGALRDRARGTDAPPNKTKVKSRSSQPHLGATAVGSKPSVPSLSGAATGPRSRSQTTRPPALASGSQPASSPLGAAAMSMRAPEPSLARAVSEPGRGNGRMFAVVGVLIAAIVVLAYFVVAK
jgi:anti-anti-sigma regulatory factor